MVQRRIPLLCSAARSLKSNHAVLVIMISFGVVSLAAVSFIGMSALKIDPGPNRRYTAHTQHIDASWAGGGQTIPQLVHGPVPTDMIAMGTFVKKSPGGHKNGIDFTNFSFQVAQVLYGNPDKSVITVHQTGGTTAEVTSDPLFKKGSTYILFLHEYSPGKYFVVAGPGGRFQMKDGKIQSYNPSGLGDGMPVSKFVKQIRAKTQGLQ